MGTRRKWSRLISVGGASYRWKVVADRDGMDWTVCIQRADAPGQRLLTGFTRPMRWHQVGPGHLSGEYLPAAITPRIIRRLIEAALERGWRPAGPGLPPFRLVGREVVPELPSGTSPEAGGLRGGQPAPGPGGPEQAVQGEGQWPEGRGMTPEEWDACTDPRRMVEHLRGRASGRKLRLFACACVRGVWDLLAGPGSREAAERAEALAEGQLSAREVETSWSGSLVGEGAADAAVEAAWAAHAAGYLDAGTAAVEASSAATRAASRAGGRAEGPAHCRLLRDIFGNPFRPVWLDPAWVTPNVVSLARAAYEERQLPSGYFDPARLAVLADALEEAGCTDPDVLGHLRGPGPHVRGCFVLDALLGRE